ncbi:hypothetical protein HDV02_005147 [Globomyces sp. JEL0801]|nr:hypothetical protein HDV02_005147 [Globomyces sp. JEL0801]
MSVFCLPPTGTNDLKLILETNPTNHLLDDNQRLYPQDIIIKELLKNRKVTLDENEQERQRRMYNMLRHSADLANSTWQEDISLTPSPTWEESNDIYLDIQTTDTDTITTRVSKRVSFDRTICDDKSIQKLPKDIEKKSSIPLRSELKKLIGKIFKS